MRDRRLAPHQTTRANGRCRQSEKTRSVDSARQLTPLAAISQKIRRKRGQESLGTMMPSCLRRAHGGVAFSYRVARISLCVVPPLPQATRGTRESVD
jgi:hypothetical protein